MPILKIKNKEGQWIPVPQIGGNGGLGDPENRVLYLDTVKDYEDMITAKLITEPNVTYIAETGEIKYYKKVIHKMICEVTPEYKNLPFISELLSMINGDIPIVITNMDLNLLTVNSLKIDNLELSPKTINTLEGMIITYYAVPDKYKEGGEFEIIYDYYIPEEAVKSGYANMALAYPPFAPVRQVYIDDYSINNALIKISPDKSEDFKYLDMYILPGYTTDVYLNFKEKHLFSLYSISIFKSQANTSYTITTLFHLMNYDASIYGIASDKDSFQSELAQGSIYGLLESFKAARLPFIIIEE